MRTTRMQRIILQKEAHRQVQLKKVSKTAVKATAVLGTTVVLSQVASTLTGVTSQVHAATYSTASTTSTGSFLATVAPMAQEVAGQNDMYASVMIAQAILESGWGTSALASAPNYNLFGIKGSYNGQSVVMNTAENDKNGNVYYINAAFRKYPSYRESLMDNVNVIKNTGWGGTKYYSGAWMSNTNNYQEATAWLKGRYATSVVYDQSLNRIIEQYNLTQYDAKNSTPGTSVTTPGTGGTTTTTQNYTVVAGDSVWGISHKYGISMSQLIAWNGISNNMIHPGQVLKVGETTTVVTPPSTGNGSNETVTTTPSNGQKYTVVAGDSVWGISHKYGISMSQLIAWNGISNNMIHPGQTLTVSAGSTSSNNNAGSGTTTTPTAPSTSNAQTYTVKAGDSVWGISHQYNISMNDFIGWNGISNNMIHPGQVVKVSAGSTTTVTTPSTSNQKYTVKAGDSLWAISQKHGMTVASLQAANGLSNYFIYPGQVLNVK